MFKRLFDIVFSLIAILLISPICIPIMIILRFSGEGEIFYLQERVGKNGKHFNITKFATMLKNSPNMGTGAVTLREDPRVLPVGKFLRKTKINELPQFWDILIGNMSFVGPRPQMPVVVDKYPPEYLDVLKKVTPGVTGVGSIVFRDEEAIFSNAKDIEKCSLEEVIPYKLELEQWYAEHQSLFVDIMLILITIHAVLNSKSQLLFKVFPSIPFKDTSKFGQS